MVDGGGSWHSLVLPDPKSIALSQLFLSLFAIYHYDKMSYKVQQGLQNASKLHSVMLESTKKCTNTHLSFRN